MLNHSFEHMNDPLLNIELEGTLMMFEKQKNKISNVNKYAPVSEKGQRMVPEYAQLSQFWEHIYRYKFASRFVIGKRVLDIACGEGYGSFLLLKAGASDVIGIDISELACTHAKKKYGIDARLGSVHSIPLDDNSIDIVVSFETLEHVSDLHQKLFLKECVRILKRNGILIVSTPNKAVWDEIGGEHPDHISELYESELESLISKHLFIHNRFTQATWAAPPFSLRSLSAINSFWLNIKGMYRLKTLLKKLFCPHLSEKMTENYRLCPEKTLQIHDNIFASKIFNPYIVKRKSKFKSIREKYFIVEAYLK